MARSTRRPAPVRHLGAIALAVLLSATALGVATPVARADASSDIPGIPLPGAIVTGVLGGPVFDVVYQLDVAPGSVVVASLTGSPTTDFDLFLFDASATTVATNVGVVASSTGPTSTESLAYATSAGGRFYIDLLRRLEPRGRVHPHRADRRGPHAPVRDGHARGWSAGHQLEGRGSRADRQ